MFPNYQARSPFVLKHTTSLCMDVCTGVTQSKIGDVYLFIYLDMYGRTYVIRLPLR